MAAYKKLKDLQLKSRLRKISFSSTPKGDSNFWSIKPILDSKQGNFEE